MRQLPAPEILATAVSNAIFNQFGFGPSQSICLPFARRVIAEARLMKGMWRQ